MLYLFHGNDIEKTRAKAFEWVAAARKKEPNLVYVRLAREELSSAALEDAALAKKLAAFRKKQTAAVKAAKLPDIS